MATTTHTWVTRAHCSECDTYLWTNPGSPSVLCRCGTASIIDNVIVVGDEVTSDYTFRQAVLADLNIPSADLDLTHEDA